MAESTAKPRGRKASGTALSPAERQRRHRERMKAKVERADALQQRQRAADNEIFELKQALGEARRKLAAQEREISDLRLSLKDYRAKVSECHAERVREGERLIAERDAALAAGRIA